MHEGLVSLILGLPGMPAVAEDVMIGRDIALAEATGGRIHIMHVSSAGSVELIRRAKARGVRVTTEVCPHHFTLTDECLRTFDSNYKMSPPLREPAARRRLHRRPGRRHDRRASAPIMRRTRAKRRCASSTRRRSASSAWKRRWAWSSRKLIEPGHLDWPQALAKMTINPARVLGIDKGTLAIGADADVTIIDPDARWTVDPDEIPLQEHQHARSPAGVCRAAPTR